MKGGGTWGSGSEGSEAVAVVCCCLAGSVDSLSCFVSFPNPFHLLVFASCLTEPARQPPPPLHRPPWSFIFTQIHCLNGTNLNHSPSLLIHGVVSQFITPIVPVNKIICSTHLSTRYWHFDLHLCRLQTLCHLLNHSQVGFSHVSVWLGQQGHCHVGWGDLC